jgi:small subunit ribosomal protein S8
MMTDPLADMLTRIRNGSRIERPFVDMPATKIKAAVAEVLKDEGFVIDYAVGKPDVDDHGMPILKPEADFSIPKLVLRVFLKYGPEGERVIRHIRRASKPGCRVYVRSKDLRPVLDGLGISILSTNRGVMSDRRARAQRMGGELLAVIW